MFATLLNILNSRKDAVENASSSREIQKEIFPITSVSATALKHILHIGDKVKLIYDCPDFPCPEMRVKSIASDEITCVWYVDDTQLKVAEFRPQVLKIV